MTRKCYACHKVDGQAAHFFGLPTNSEVRQKWLQWIANRVQCEIHKIPQRAFLCSDHFDPKDMFSRKLRPGSVPSDTLPFSVASSSSNVIPCRTGRDRFPDIVKEEMVTDNNNSQEQWQERQGPSDTLLLNVASSSSSNVLPCRTGRDRFPDIVTEEMAQKKCTRIIDVKETGDTTFLATGTQPDFSNELEPIYSSLVVVDMQWDQIKESRETASPDKVPVGVLLKDLHQSSESETLLSVALNEHLQISSDLFADHITVNLEGVEFSANEPSNVQTETGFALDESHILENIVVNNSEVQKCSTPGHCSKPETETFVCVQDSTIIECSIIENSTLDKDSNAINICSNFNVNNLGRRNLSSDNVNKSAVENNGEYSSNDLLSSVLEIESIYQNSEQSRGLRRKCFAQNCCNSNNKTVHAFPAIVINGRINHDNMQKCKLWIQRSGNTKLLEIYSSKLQSRCGLCSDHFDDCQYYNASRKRLLPNALPKLNPNWYIPEEDMITFPKWGPHDVFNESDIDVHNNTDNSIDDEQLDNNLDDHNGNVDCLQKKFEDTMSTLEWRHCPHCMERFFTKKTSKKKCCHSKKICTALSKDNGFDPGLVPPELQGLTSIEEQLISPIHPVVQVCKVKGHQFSYKGNIINFPQDVKSFASKLPHNIHSLKSTIKIRTSKDANNFKDFDVRANVVRRALIWLQSNNPYFFDIHISEENINLLPEDGNVYDLIEGVDMEDEQDEEETVTEDDLVTQTNVPMCSLPSEKDQIESVIDWPTIGEKPIDEFTSEGYIVKAFPTLFPYGVCDISNSRRQKMSDSTYFQHLMRYKDGRFASHNRFRFFALNSLMRWSALTDGNIFIKRNPEFKDMTVADLKEKLEEHPSLMKKIMFQGSNIRGTKAFWHSKGKELQAMIEQLSLPTIFITLSAADMHWPELFKLLAPEEDVETMTEFRRRQLIQENPLVVDEFFLTRAETFLQDVLTPKYKISDFWFRIEYQHRGSPHLHGLCWLEGAPDVSNILNFSEEQKGEVINYFDKLICTMNPNLNEPPAPIHPCRKNLSKVDDFQQDLAQLLNRVQRHTVCTPGYCLKGNPPKCRFGFPIDMQETTLLDCSDKNNVKLVTERNDSRLNKYNAYIIQTWRGNIDVSPVLSEQALINYLAKYVAKSEVRSQSLIDFMKNIVANTDEDKPAKSAIQRIFIKTCSERDYSAQETCHILMGLKLYSKGSRNCVSINFNETSEWQRVRNEKTATSLPLLDLYKNRDDSKANVCLWNMAKYHKVKNQDKFNIIRVYPFLKLKSSSQADNEQYYRQQCLLFVPWRNEEQLQGDKSWEEIYHQNLELIKANSDKIRCLLGEPEEDAMYEEYEREVLGREQWMAVSQMGPNKHIHEVELGFREIDLNKNWHYSLLKYQELGGLPYLQSFLNNAKKDFQTNSASSEHLELQLTPEQLQVVELAKQQILMCQNEDQYINCDIPKKVIVQGKAGTGKSVIVSQIVQHVKESLGEGSIVVLGPTGVSAVNVNGSTIQSKLKITSRRKNNPGDADNFIPLKGPAVHDLNQTFENVKFIIMDEFSMIGCSMLSKIDQRLRQAKGNPNEDFGGCNMYLFGDIKQLSPVADSAPYSTTQTTVHGIRGKQLYDNMDAAFILEKIHRQNDEAFLRALNNISIGKVSRNDYELLQTRFCTKLHPEELKEFRNALHLFPTTDQVHEFNKNALSTLREQNAPVPVVCVPANHNVTAASKGSINDAEGLEPKLYLSEGAKIMLRVNLWTERGLVNGAMGEIQEILYNENSHPSHDLPSVLICKFPSYKGPYLDPVNKTVPIVPLTKSWNNDDISCSREQFPVTLAYATTIHKSQGLTLLKAYVDIGSKEMSPGLTYVALSRVKTLSGLVLAPFNFNRLNNLKKSAALKKRITWENLLIDKAPLVF